MFVVFNKSKIVSYIILLSTVLILFGMASRTVSYNVIETSTNTHNLENSVNLIENNRVSEE